MIWLIGAGIVAYHFSSWAVFWGLVIMAIGIEGEVGIWVLNKDKY